MKINLRLVCILAIYLMALAIKNTAQAQDLYQTLHGSSSNVTNVDQLVFAPAVFVSMVFGGVMIPKWLVGVSLVTASAGMTLATGVVILGGTIYSISSLNKYNLGTSTKFSKAIHDHDGWNWSAKVKSVKREMVWDFVNYIETGYPEIIKTTHVRQ
jgi:hypothetical protein